MIERPQREYQSLSVQAQHRYRVRMMSDRTSATVVLTASSASAVIDMVKSRRIATLPGMTFFSVDLADDQAVR